MTIADEVAKVAPQPKEQEKPGTEAQLDQLEQVEGVLKHLGMPLKERYQIPLSRRLGVQTERKA